MVEVPDHFQKPHEIFISEQADWKFEDSTHEETDPLCLEEEQDYQNIAGGEQQSTLRLPVRTHRVIKEERGKLADAIFPPSEMTVKQEKIHRSTVVTSATTHRNRAVSQCVTGNRTVKMEQSPPYDGYSSDTELGSTLRDVDLIAASAVQKADDDKVEVIDRHVFCSGHGRKRIPYAQMITMAIMDAPNWQILLQEIYTYTKQNFPWVKFRGNWWNSIRHTLSLNPLFMKTKRMSTRNAHYWSVVPSFMEILQEHLRLRNHSCCKWELVSRLQQHCTQMLPRHQKPWLWKDSARLKTNKRSPSTRKNDSRSLISSDDSCRVSMRLANGRRKLECQNSSNSILDCKTDSRDLLDDSLDRAPPLKPVIVNAIMQSPYRHVPLSVIYAHCIIHCPYYRNKRKLCITMIKRILAKEPCFKRIPQEDNKPDYWMYDKQYKDGCQPPGGHVSTTTCKPWEHDHGLYPKQLPPDSVEVSGTGQDVSPICFPDSSLTDTVSEPGSDTDRARRHRGSSQRSPAGTECSGRGANKGGTSTSHEAESEHGYSPKRPRVYSRYRNSVRRGSGLHSGHPDLDKPSEACDELDIKEEPLPEELPMENIFNEEN